MSSSNDDSALPGYTTEVLHDVAVNVLIRTRIPGNVTLDGVTLLTGVTLTWPVLRRVIDVTSPITALNYLVESALRTALAIPVWTDEDWDHNLSCVAFPTKNALFPGEQWTQEDVRGGALRLGYAARNLDAREPDRILPVLPGVVEACGVKFDSGLWGLVRSQHEHMGQTAGLLYRIQADAGHRRLRPMWGADVLTLVASQRYREQLLFASGPRDGMLAVAVPHRYSGWILGSQDSPEFTEAIAVTAGIEEEAFSRGLLVTALEVAESKNRQDFL